MLCYCTPGLRELIAQVEHAIKRAPLADRKRKRTDGAVDSTGTESAQLAPVSAPSADGLGKPSEAGSSKRRLQGSARHVPTQPKRTGGDKHRLACTVALGNLSAVTKDAALAAAQAAGKVPTHERWSQCALLASVCGNKLNASRSAAAAQVLNIVDPAPTAGIDAAKLRTDGCTGDILFCEYDTARCNCTLVKLDMLILTGGAQVSVALDAVWVLRKVNDGAQINNAMAAVAKLHGLPLQLDEKAGSRKREASKECASSTSVMGQQLWARQVGGEGAHAKACRVIVRNLPFQVRRSSYKDLYRCLLHLSFEGLLSSCAGHRSRCASFVQACRFCLGADTATKC